MAKRRHTFKMVNPRSGKTEGFLSFLGGTAKKAESKARSFAKRHKLGFDSGRRRKKNVEMGFFDQRGRFHPIRASSDYSESRATRSTKIARGHGKRTARARASAMARLLRRS